VYYAAPAPVYYTAPEPAYPASTAAATSWRIAGAAIGHRQPRPARRDRGGTVIGAILGNGLAR